MDGVDAGVDVVGVGGGLVVHALVDRRRYRIREIRDCSRRTGLILRLEGMNSYELDLDRENTKEADEEACEGGRMKYILEEPAEVDMMLWRQFEERRELVRQSRDERMSGIGPKHEQVVIREANGRRSCVHVVCESGVRHPGLTGVLEVSLLDAPFVPFEETVASEEEEDADDDEDEADLGDLE